ncbi:hypothetical protein D9M72_181020 [compost metagenome]
MQTSSREVGVRLARKPPSTPDTANSQKKLLPTRPNCAGVSPSSSIIGAASRPTTILSMALTTRKKNNSAAVSHARRGW